MKGIPTFGHGSRTAAVERLLKEGRSREEIAAQLGTTASRVGSMIHHAPRQMMVEVRIPMGTIRRLKHAADARQINTHELVRQLVDVIARDQIVDAILDDAIQTDEAST